jgi:hypothetical protein
MTGTIDPARFGMPDATTAGVQAGVTLTAYRGPMTITTPGAVIENVIIDGTITVAADNVTFKNCVIRNFDNWGILSDNADNTRVEYCDIDGSGSTRTSGLGIGGGTNSAIIGCDISGMVIGIQLAGRAVVRDNYIHDLADTSSNPDARHFDGITVFGGQNGSVIEHNTISMPTGSGGTAAVFIKTEFGSIDNIQVRNNLMTGDPSYTVYVESTTRPITNVTVENNYVEKGIYGYFYVTNSTPILRNNVQWNNNTDATPYPTSSPNPPSTPTPPSVPTIASFSNDSGVANDKVTNDRTLTLTGSAAAGSTVKVLDGGNQIGTVTANASGSWTYTTAALSEGNHSLTATATTSAGTSAVSAALAVRIDTTAPTAPTIATPTNSANGRLNLTGTAEANSVVKVYDGATEIGTATANGSGVWGYTTGTLATGSHSLTAKATDAAGNTGAASAVVTASTGTGTSPPPSPAPSGTTMESAGSTSLVQVGNNYFLNSVSSGKGPELKLNGSPVVAGQFLGWEPVAAEQSATGYKVAMKATASGQVVIWTVDINGNYVTNAAPVSGTSSTLKSAEAHFQQDLNSDGVIGIPTTVVEATGSTSLVKVGDNYFLNSLSSGIGPELKLNGSPVVAGQFPGWEPVAAEQSATGYQVAMKATASGQVVIWTVDINGNYVTNAAPMSATSSTLKSAETRFQQDLNGDGVLGIPSGTSSGSVTGTSGDNRLTGTSGNDVFKGNGGHDTFAFAANFGNDIITDFGAGRRSHDVVEFSKTVFDDFADVLAHASQSGQDVVIDAGGGNSLTLKNTSLSSLDRSDFHFV